MTHATRVLFMQSQHKFGADSQVHHSIMKHLPSDRYDVHCALTNTDWDVPNSSPDMVRKLPNVTVRRTDFGPSLEEGSKAQRALAMLTGVFPMIWSLLGLVLYIRRNDIELVHCTEKPRSAFYGAIVAKLAGSSCIVHVHVKAEPWLGARVLWAMAQSRGLIGVSDFVSESCVEMGCERAKVHTVLNGLELENWESPSAEDRAAIREEFGISDDDLVIVSAARLYRYKGQHDLLAALPAVNEQVPGVKVLIVGKDDQRGFRGDASYTDLLKQMCTDLALWDQVTFTGWRTDVRELMSAGDLYVMPSFEEPFGMVFVEAMYLRRPVVALNNGGAREAVDHGGSGLLAEPGDIDELSSHIITLLSDDVLRAQMGDRGHERVTNVLNAQVMAERTADVYDEILAS